MKERGILNIVCGFTSQTGNVMRKALSDAAEAQGYDSVFISRYRKEGIAQYVQEHRAFDIVILQEVLQSGNPYMAEELVELADDLHLLIIVSLSNKHRGNVYMKQLYTAGILNALYEEDATADQIMHLILHPRTRSECRKYYNIKNPRDAMQTLDIIDEERLKGYLAYLQEGENREDFINRYDFIAKKLKIIENIYLAQHLPESVIRYLSDQELFLHYNNLSEKKRRFFCQKKRRKKKPFFDIGERREGEANRDEAGSGNETAQNTDCKAKKTTDLPNYIQEDIFDLLGFNNNSESTYKEKEQIHAVPEESLFLQEEKQSFTDLELRSCGVNIAADGKDKNITKIRNLAIIIICVLMFGTVVFIAVRSRVYTERNEPIVERTDSRSELPINVENTGQSVEKAKKEIPKEVSPKEVPPKEKKLSTSKGQEKSKSPETPINVEIGQTGSTEEYKAETNKTAISSSMNSTVPTEEILTEPAAESVQIVIEQEETQETTQPPTGGNNYAGKIFTGNEIISVAGEYERRGIQIFLKTRTYGDGYHSAGEIAGMVDDTCSYLVLETGDGGVTFIQQ